MGAIFSGHTRASSTTDKENSAVLFRRGGECAMHVYETYFADQEEPHLPIDALKAVIYMDRKILARRDPILGSRFLYALPVKMAAI
jgi:hypothetical protein